MPSPETAALVAAACLAVVTLFQIGLAAGAPWGVAAYGGQHAGRLPSHLRASSAVAVVVWPMLALVVLRRAGHTVWSPVPDSALTVVTWVVVGFLALSVVMNGISRSRVERGIWTPMCLVAGAASLVVALS